MRTFKLVLVFATACSSNEPAGNGDCKSNDDCLAGEVCDAGECITLCYSDLECDGDLVCDGQICVEGQRDLPVITAVDGDGDLICNDTPGSHCVASGLTVTGRNLAGATFHWQPDGGSVAELVLHDGASNTGASFDLPVTTAPGLYVLTAVNKVGSADQALELLQGTPGEDGAAFSPTSDELVTLINAASNTIDSARLNVGTATGSVAAGDHTHPPSPRCDSAGNCSEVCVGSDCRSAWPDSRVYVHWGDTTCDASETTLYTGAVWQSGVSDGFGGGIVCSTSTSVEHYTNIGGSQAWRAARLCAVCASPEARFCYTKWGDTTCATGFSSRYSGYMFGGGTGSGKGAGDLVCASGTQVQLHTRIGGNRTWRNAPECAVCCSD